MRLSTGIWAALSTAWVIYVATNMPWQGQWLLYGFLAATIFPAIAFGWLMLFRHIAKAWRPRP
jgi:hypothetical protein